MRTLEVALVAIALSHGACSDSRGSSSGAVVDVGDAADTTASETDTTVASCTAPGFGGGEVAAQVDSVEATLIGADGVPAASVSVIVCGIDICSAPGTTDASGHVLVRVGLALKSPHFVFGDGLTYAHFALPVASGATQIGTVHALALTTEGAAMGAGAGAVSGDVTLELAGGTVILIDTLSFDTPDAQRFRAATLASADASALIDGAFGAAPVYGLGPSDTTFCPPARVTVVNSAHWAAGAHVDLWLLGTDTSQAWASFGGWAKIGAGTVSADGLTVSSDDGRGLPLLTSFAFGPPR